MAYTLGEANTNLVPVVSPTTKSNWFSDFASGFNQLAPGASSLITAIRQPRNQITNQTTNQTMPSSSGSWYKSPVVLVAGVGLLAVVLLASRRK